MTDSMRCRGMRDLAPEDMALFRQIETVFRDVCTGWGYQELRTPIVEHLHLFTSAGTLSPQMLGRVYSFLDWDGWSGERVVLRPDSTIPVARAYSESAALGEVWKRFYVQNVLRFASGDESREDWQCGIELIGDSQPVADVEIIAIACEVLANLGLDVQITLSDPAIMRAVLARAGYDATQQIDQYDRLLDGNVEVLDEIAQRIDGAGATLRAMLSLEGEGSAYIRNLSGTLGALVPEVEQPLTNLLSVSAILESLGRNHSVSPLLVRNFEYYTGPVFRIKSDGITLAGGGRYNDLIGLVGGPDVLASGFALEMEAIMSVLPPVGMQPPRVLVRPGAQGDQGLAATFALTSALRGAGVGFLISGGAIAAGEAEAVVDDGGYTLRLNGAAPQRFVAATELVQALTAADG